MVNYFGAALQRHWGSDTPFKELPVAPNPTNAADLSGRHRQCDKCTKVVTKWTYERNHLHRVCLRDQQGGPTNGERNDVLAPILDSNCC